MSRDITVIPFRQPDAVDDPLSEVAREGARRMLAQVLIAEAYAFVAQWKDLKLPDGRDRVVRHGHGPQRAIQTGIGPVEVRRAKVRDRGDVSAGVKIRFTSSILPKWARRTKSLDAAASSVGRFQFLIVEASWSLCPRPREAVLDLGVVRLSRRSGGVRVTRSDCRCRPRRRTDWRRWVR